MIDLKGHSALVTGSSKGVGRAIAMAFAEAGADVIVHAREMSDDVAEVINAIESAGRKSGFIAADLSAVDEKMVEDIFHRTIELLPRCDILINNAGAFFDLPFEQMTFERFDKTLRLNVTSGYFLTQRFAKHWIEHQTRGRVIFVGSINGRLAEQNSTGYDTSKGAVEMMVKTLAVALAPEGIRVNGMAPGLVRTHATAWLDTRLEKARWMEYHTPNGQVPGPEVCGPATVFLCSDAAEHIHGHMLLVDGGMSAWQQPNPPAKK